mgnify:CR=1 FL=1
MGIFDFLKKEEQPEDIWAIRDKDEFVVTMWDIVSEKADYGDNMFALNQEERVFYIVQQLEMEVNNGGFSQFFYNSSGDLSNELVYACNEIYAYRTAELCQRALDAFGRPMPVDRMEREEFLDELESDRVDEILDACDEAFYKYPDDIETLCYEYIFRNRSAFSNGELVSMHAENVTPDTTATRMEDSFESRACPVCGNPMRKGIVKVQEIGGIMNNVMVNWFPDADKDKLLQTNAITLRLKGEGYYCDECMKVFAEFEEK